MIIYEAQNYRDFLRFQLDWEKSQKKGYIKKLANHIKCHPTYVSQILAGKAHLSNEQAVRVCGYFNLNGEESEFFLDLVNRDRAGDNPTRSHFQQRIDRTLADRQHMKKRWKQEDRLTDEQKMMYYESWIPQAVHILCQLEENNTQARIEKTLGLRGDIVDQTLSMLEKSGLITKKASRYFSVKNTVHLGKDSPLIAPFHINWRLKTIQKLTETKGQTGIHYSSVVSLSKAAVDTITNLIYQHLEQTRDTIIASPAELLYCYHLDFYSLSNDD